MDSQEPVPVKLPLVSARDPRFGLTQKQLMFVCRYIVHGNASRAVIESGYKCANGANRTAYDLLRLIKIRAAIDELRGEALAENKVDVDYVVKNLLAESENFGHDANSSSRIKALTTIGDWLGMFKENVEHNVKIDILPTLEDLISARNQLLKFRDQISDKDSAADQANH